MNMNHNDSHASNDGTLEPKTPELPSKQDLYKKQVESLGSAIWHANRRDEGGVSSIGANNIAKSILFQFHVSPHGGKAVGDVVDERARQDVKWGQQNHPDGTGRTSTPLNRIVHNGPISSTSGSRSWAIGLSLLAKAATDKAAKEGTVSWADILLEEVFEALAESDPEKLRTELIQTAAVATQWAEAIDRRQRIAEGEAIQKAEEADNA